VIRSIEIRNWKAHDYLELSFAEGVNFLVGPNAVGKTSVLEAVCLALLGDLSACPAYASFDLRNLRRDPERYAEIRLQLSSKAATQWTVQRRFAAGAGRRSAELRENGHLKSSAWDDVTRMIVKEYEADSHFFSKVVFLSEGDTFEYSARPPGEALTRHIESVLGLNRFEVLRANLRDIARKFEEGEQGARAARRAARARSDGDSQRAIELSEEIADLEGTGVQLEQQIAGIQESRRRTAVEMTSVQHTVTRIQRLALEWQTTLGKPFPPEPLSVLDDAIAELAAHKGETIAELERLRDEAAALQAAVAVQRDVVRLMDLTQDAGQTTCPVCRRDLTPEMVQEIRRECAAQVANLDDQQEATQRSLKTWNARLAEVGDKHTALAELRAKVRGMLDERAPIMDIPALETRLETLHNMEEKQAGEVAELDRRLDETKEGAVRRSVELERIREQPSAADLERIRQARIAGLRGQHMSELVRTSLDGAVAEQRRVVLEPMMAELSGELSRFLRSDVEARLNEQAQLEILQTGSGNTLSFPQLSGGEKTALLVFTQMFLCKYFSTADFMLLDEPLEHLDPDNRRGLVDFLVAAGKAGYPKQLIITTFEETLVREHLDDPTTRIVYLTPGGPAATSYGRA